MMQKTIFVSIMIIGMLGAVATTQADTQNKESVSEDFQVPLNELIVKFKDDSPLGHQVLAVFGENLPFESVTKQTFLDQLNEKYFLKKISKLHKGTQNIDQIKKKFQERAKRAPANASIPNFDYVYLFEFNGEFDINQVARDYAQSPHVEYAHPQSMAAFHK